MTKGAIMFTPKNYVVLKIDGDYAILKRTDIEIDDNIKVARALLPMDIDEGTQLLWEDLEYKII